MPRSVTHPNTSVRDAIADLPDINDFAELETGDEVLLNFQQVEQGQKTASFYARYLGLAE